MTDVVSLTITNRDELVWNIQLLPESNIYLLWTLQHWTATVSITMDDYKIRNEFQERFQIQIYNYISVSLIFIYLLYLVWPNICLNTLLYLVLNINSNKSKWKKLFCSVLCNFDRKVKIAWGLFFARTVAKAIQVTAVKRTL